MNQYFWISIDNFQRYLHILIHMNLQWIISLFRKDHSQFNIRNIVLRLFRPHCWPVAQHSSRFAAFRNGFIGGSIIIRANSEDFFMAPVGWSNGALLLSRDRLPSLLFFLHHFYNGPKKGSPFSPRIENNAESSAAGEIRRGPASTPRVWYIDDTGVGVADLEED